MSRIQVWDPLVRIVHWCVAMAVILNYWVVEAGEVWHERIGWSAAALVTIRIAWGFVGTPYARLRNFFPTPTRIRDEIRHLRSGARTRPLGHTPIAAIGMLLFWTLILVLGGTGWMMSFDRFFGEEWLESVHNWSAQVLVWTAGFHVIMVIAESFRARENLPGAMITGKKRIR